MYEPARRSKLYLLIIAAMASLIGWAFFTFYRPLVIEAGCSEIAANTSTVLGKRNSEVDAFFSYDNTKHRCLEDLGDN